MMNETLEVAENIRDYIRQQRENGNIVYRDELLAYLVEEGFGKLFAADTLNELYHKGEVKLELSEYARFHPRHELVVALRN